MMQPCTKETLSCVGLLCRPSVQEMKHLIAQLLLVVVLKTNKMKMIMKGYGSTLASDLGLLWDFGVFVAP